MADDRTYIRVHDGMDENAKIEALSDKAFRLLVSLWCYCSRNRNDGRIPNAAWAKRGTAKARRELLDAGLADQRDGFVEMHDYLEHQRSADEIRLLQEVRGDNGVYGNHVRWHVVKKRPKKGCDLCYPPDEETPGAVAKAIANGIANAIANPSQADRKPVASTEAEAEAKNSYVVRGGSHVSSDSPDEPPRCPQHKGTPRAETPGCWACKGLRETWEQQQAADTVFARPAWCGDCNEFTRLIDSEDDDTPSRRCNRCHPLAKESA